MRGRRGLPPSAPSEGDWRCAHGSEIAGSASSSWSVFVATWIGQLVFEWLEYADEAADHGQTAVFWSQGFWVVFWQSTLENWQSEFLQLSAFTIAGAYLVYKGSSESSDGTERIEAKVDFLLQRAGSIRTRSSASCRRSSRSDDVACGAPA